MNPRTSIIANSSDLSNLKILVSGATGFLGARTLLGFPPELRSRAMGLVRSNNFQQESLKGVNLQKFDLAVDNSKIIDCEVLIHLAATNQSFCQTNPVDSFNVNIAGTSRLLSAVGNAAIQHVIFVSTIHVYGIPGADPITESTQTRPVSEYARQRLEMEKLIIEFCDARKIHCSILRLSNAIGWVPNPVGESWSLIGNFVCREAVRSGIVKLKSDGLQRRNFIGASDVVRAIQLCVQKKLRGIFNLGGNEYMRVSELVRLAQETLKNVSGRGFEVFYGKQHEADTGFIPVFDSSKIKNAGFAVSPALTEELQLTFKHLLAEAHR